MRYRQSAFAPRMTSLCNIDEYLIMTHLFSKTALAGALALLAAGSAFAQADAASFPNKMVTIVVGYPPGGGPDLSARLYAEKLSKRWGQSVVVENRAGVSGMIGASHVARANADGHTLLIAPNTFVSAPLFLPKDSIRVYAEKDFKPVFAPSKGAMIMLAHPSLGLKNAKDLVEHLKKTPNEAYASPGVGSPMHIAGELFKQSAGVNMMHVPYKGVAPAIADVLGGHVKITYSSTGAVASHIQSGTLIPLGVAEEERSALTPDIPTLKEQGFENASTGAWYGVYAPKNTPDAIVNKLNEDFNAILKDPDTLAKLKTLWEQPVGGPPSVLAEQVKAEYERYYTVAKRLNLLEE